MDADCHQVTLQCIGLECQIACLRAKVYKTKGVGIEVGDGVTRMRHYYVQGVLCKSGTF